MKFPTMAKSVKYSLALLALVMVLQISCVSGQGCIPPLVVKGKKFFESTTGKYVPIKGVNYYPRPNEGELSTGGSRDYFTEGYRAIWERDIAEFQALGINAIRLYAVDPGADHDSFMCALQAAGIYVEIGLSATCEDCAITEDFAPTCYPAALKERGQFIINVFSKYENVVAFSVGNEVNLVAPNDQPETNAACQKQFLRDMREFVTSCEQFGMRQIPIGVVIADVDREENALYYGCRTNPTDELENAEWYGLNTYVHCDGLATDISQLTGFQILLADFAAYNLPYPVMLTEYGCLNPSFPTIDGYEAQRTWLQVEAIYAPEYRDEFSGGFVFEYNTEKVYAQADSPHPHTTYGPGNYGVGYFIPENCDDLTIPCSYERFPQFALLAEKFDEVDTSSESDLASYSPGDASYPACPEGFPALSDFTWPSAAVANLVCWGPGGFTCPNTNCGASSANALGVYRTLATSSVACLLFGLIF